MTPHARIPAVAHAAQLRREPGQRTMTLAEWADMPEDEPGELVDGRLEDEEVPDALHELVVVWFATVLNNWVSPRGGVVLGSEAKFAVAVRRGRKPDLSVYLPGGRLPPRRGVVRVPPDIAVEVVSPTPRDGRRDRIEKNREYAAFGVAHSWIVDPQMRSIEVFERDRLGRYALVLGASEGVVKNIPGCKGLSLDLDALWREVDRLPEGSV